MSETYKATVRGTTIEWEGEAPDAGNAFKVDVRVRESPDRALEPNGRRAMAALQRIAEKGGIQSIVDPVAWLREIRKDRPLPGRE